MAKKLPAMPVYIGDLKKDPGFMGLKHDERWLAMDVFFMMWESEQRGKLILNGIGIDGESIASMLGVTVERWNEFREKIVRLGVVKIEEKVEKKTGKVSEILFNSRMIKDEKTRQIRSESGRKGGKASVDAGILLNQNPSKTEAKGQAKAKQNVDNDNDNEDDNEKDLSTKKGNEYHFEIVWKMYPEKLGKPASMRHFRASVKTDEDWKNIQHALEKYKSHVEKKGISFKNGSTWFNNWREWVDYVPPPEHIPAVRATPTVHQKNLAPVLAELERIQEKKNDLRGISERDSATKLLRGSD